MGCLLGKEPREPGPTRPSRPEEAHRGDPAPHGAPAEAGGCGGTAQRSEPGQPERRHFVRHLCRHTQAISRGWTSTASD